MATTYYSNGDQIWYPDTSNHNHNVHFRKANESEREINTIKGVARMIRAEEEGRVPKGTVAVCLEYNSEKLGVEKEDLFKMAIPYTIDDDSSETSQIS